MYHLFAVRNLIYTYAKIIDKCCTNLCRNYQGIQQADLEPSTILLMKVFNRRPEIQIIDKFYECFDYSPLLPQAVDIQVVCKKESQALQVLSYRIAGCRNY